MKTSSCAALASFSIALAFAASSPAQENQDSHGSPGTPPPPVYTPPPPVSGGYTTPYYQPAPPPPMGPKKMKYNEGDPVPPGYRVEERTRTGLVVGGAVLFGVTYLITALIGSIASDLNDKDGKWLLLPVVGPFVYSTTTESSTAKTWLYIDGLAQAGGVTMFIVGLAGQKMLIRNDVASRVQVLPMIGRTNGLSLIATF